MSCDKFQQLAELGAGDFEHLNGDLLTHLKGTQKLLKHWGANTVICDAGLYHAAYGTAGFEQSMISLNRRDKIAAIIGKQAERLVYLYSSCDRDYTFAHITSEKIEFRDRFNDSYFELASKQMTDFCELTVANEMELVLSDKSFKKQYGAALLELFDMMQPHLSEAAKNCYRQELA